MIANYHTHTRWCNHGSGEIEEYVMQAIDCGLEQLAITEHVPLPGDPDRSRMAYKKFPTYNAELDGVIAKYQGQIDIIKGFECEYSPEVLALYREYRERYGYELFVLGQHVNAARTVDYFFVDRPQQLASYADEVCEGLETGLFAFLAHPDVVMYSYPRVDSALLGAMKQIFALCERLHIPVEMNGNGMNTGRGYPCRQVWELAAQYRLDCIVNSDAHHVRDLVCPGVAGCRQLAEELGLRVIDRLPDYGAAERSCAATSPAVAGKRGGKAHR